MLCKTIHVHTDNIGFVSAVNNQSAKDRLLMTLIRWVVLLLLRYHIMLVAFHVPGIFNYLLILYHMVIFLHFRTYALEQMLYNQRSR